MEVTSEDTTSVDDEEKKSASSTRRSSTRGRRTRTTTAKSDDEKTAETADEDAGETAPKRATNTKQAPETSGDDAKDADEESPRTTRSRSTRSRTRKSESEEAETPTKTTAKKPAKSDNAAPTVDLSPLVKAIEQQGKQIEALSKALQDGQAHTGTPTYAPPARVGVFVDVANVELGADRARIRLDWGKVLRLLSRDRQLIRAIAYSPVHDDPHVSRETQRFVEPFLDKGYKIVTKPLKRFADGTIKANVDIEMALDVVGMLDRLDVVCLVSGDGDFEPLVVAAQNRGVRVEVVAMGNSCANQLREASDAFIDLQAKSSEVRA